LAGEEGPWWRSVSVREESDKKRDVRGGERPFWED
jgi:hypothetical protein